jgi:hypothetical protein
MDLTQPAESFKSCKNNITRLLFIDSISIDAEDYLIHFILAIGLAFIFA